MGKNANKRKVRKKIEKITKMLRNNLQGMLHRMTEPDVEEKLDAAVEGREPRKVERGFSIDGASEVIVGALRPSPYVSNVRRDPKNPDNILADLRVPVPPPFIKVTYKVDKKETEEEEA